MRSWLYILCTLCCISASAQSLVCDSVQIHFHQGRSFLDMNLRTNRQVLDDIKNKIRLDYGDSTYYRLRRVLVVGGASPEGSIPLNERLSRKRAATLFDYLSQYTFFPDSVRHVQFLGRDWHGLIRLAEKDETLPYKDETIALLQDIAEDTGQNRSGKGDGLKRFRTFKKGVPYAYMYRRHFPELRASSMYLWYSKVDLPVNLERSLFRKEFVMPPLCPEVPPFTVLEPEKRKPLYLAVKTNALYDLALVPNIGVDVYVGKNWSVAANWMYAWWKSDRIHWYWRTYGGDIAVRKWFGRKAAEKPLTGHHIGLYAQMVTYDFETGGHGYLGDRWSYAGGVEYGYSHPIARRWNLDFTIGMGYLEGEYHEYDPEDGCYVWKSTKNRRWFGPTKAEVSLVWLLGYGNENRKKGGDR